MQATIAAASNQFAEGVWGQLATHSRKGEVRTQAVARLQGVAQHHKAQLEALQKDIDSARDFNKNIANWTEEAQGHIVDLLGRKQVDPVEFEELRRYTQMIMNELTTGPADVDTVLSRVRQQAAFSSRAPSRLAKHERTSSVGGQSALRRLNLPLSASTLRRNQAANTQSAAQVQFLAAQAGGSGGFGPPPPPPPGNPGAAYAGGPDPDHGRGQGSGGPPNDPDDGDDGDDAGGRGRGPPRGPPFRPWGTTSASTLCNSTSQGPTTERICPSSDPGG